MTITSKVFSIAAILHIECSRITWAEIYRSCKNKLFAADRSPEPVFCGAGSGSKTPGWIAAVSWFAKVPSFLRRIVKKLYSANYVGRRKSGQVLYISTVVSIIDATRATGPEREFIP
jgi:hypothetical protein